MSVYLDNAATSFPKPSTVYLAVERYMREIGTSPGRGTYSRARAADEVVARARAALARLLNIPRADRLVFTSNVTESLNLAIKGAVRPGDHVVTTAMEHNAVWRCLKALESEGVIEVAVAPCGRDGTLDPDDLLSLLRPATRLIVMVHASNVTGTLMPVEAVASAARLRGISLLLDAAQTAGAYELDVQALGVDLLAFTGHKGLLGPQGTGGLYIRDGIVLRPLKEGGTGSESVLERQPDELPDRYEAGTLNGPGIAGLGAAAEFLLAEGIRRVAEHERALTREALGRLSKIPGLLVYGPKDPDRQVGVISFNLSGISPADLAYALDEMYGIMVRAGLHCAPQAHRSLGTIDQGTVRASFSYLSTTSDVERLAGALHDIASR
ncbi:MAG: aminotransferase class V-fold PLP-dependent enzyme [Bacillota bacterium]|nr:aminotransferase class V-fold PLP-dependent enzyme [Bacillota bacterium]